MCKFLLLISLDSIKVNVGDLTGEDNQICASGKNERNEAQISGQPLLDLAIPRYILTLS